jgi:hypothetical protein
MDTNTSDVVWQETKALIIGRAYPEPSKKHIETVCTGAITEDGALLRLYPISWRYLNANQQYKLWTWAKFEIRKSPDDKRQESYRVREESIELLSSVESHSERYSLLRNAIFADRETLDGRYREDWISLGLVEIELIDFNARLVKGGIVDKPHTKQGHLYVDVKPLDRVPVEMRLRYRCKNNPACRGHFSRLIGWEYMEAFRNFRQRYGSDSAGIQKITEAVRARFSKPKTSALALLGTHSRYPVWMIGQLYFFENKDQNELLF